MDKKEFWKAVEKEASAAEWKVINLKDQQSKIAAEIEYWIKQAESARTVATRLGIEANSASDDAQPCRDCADFRWMASARTAASNAAPEAERKG